MSVPKKRRTKSSVNKRRSHHSLKKVTLNKCPKCGKLVMPHRACSFCGEYNGSKVLDIKEPAKKSKK